MSNSTFRRQSRSVERAAAVGAALAVMVGVLLVPSHVDAGVAADAGPAAERFSAGQVFFASGGGTTPQIAVGGFHSCVLLTDGTVRCWGRNSFGRLGDGTTTDRLNPVSVLASGTAEANPVELTGVTQIALGYESTCALLTDETVRCWGSGSFGRLGDGESESRSNPVPVLKSGTADANPVELAGVTQIAPGWQHTCALLTDGTVRCWGSGADGRLGDGELVSRSHPVAVLVSGTADADPVELTGVTRVAAGDEHTCALLTDETVRCWGQGGEGRLGDGTTESRSHPVVVLATGNATMLESNPDRIELKKATQISLGARHTCALLPGGAVRCWGRNAEGQMGNGRTSTIATSNPVAVLESGTAEQNPVELTGVMRVTLNGLSACALLTKGTVRCWGAGNNGRLGDGESVSRSNPVKVLSAGTAAENHVELTGAMGVALGAEHTCALLTDETVRCWGLRRFGRLGDGTGGEQNALNPATVLASGTAAESPMVFSVRAVASETGSGTESASNSLPAMDCGVADLRVGAETTCTVTGGDPGIDILWRAAYNPVFAGQGVTLDADGVGTFAFTVPAAALGQVVTVELVEWLAPVSLGVVGGPVPTSVPSGGGPVPVWSLVMLALAGGLVLRRMSAVGVRG